MGPATLPAAVPGPLLPWDAVVLPLVLALAAVLALVCASPVWPGPTAPDGPSPRRRWLRGLRAPSCCGRSGLHHPAAARLSRRTACSPVGPGCPVLAPIPPAIFRLGEPILSPCLPGLSGVSIPPARLPLGLFGRDSSRLLRFGWTCRRLRCALATVVNPSKRIAARAPFRFATLPSVLGIPRRAPRSVLEVPTSLVSLAHSPSQRRIDIRRKFATCTKRSCHAANELLPSFPQERSP